jgi:acetyl-CoA acetyltransferase
VPDRDVVILGAARTPIGKYGGSFRDLHPAELGAVAARAAIERAGLKPADIDEVLIGHGRQAGSGPNPGRQVGHRAGIPDGAPAQTINKACASGLQAIVSGAQSILLGESDVVLGLTIDDFDLVELNEAFAAQVLAVLAVLKDVPTSSDRLNVNGGAIALGHPIGCTGARIVVTLLHELERRNARRGLATLCVSGGMGMAVAIERL